MTWSTNRGFSLLADDVLLLQAEMTNLQLKKKAILYNATNVLYIYKNSL